MSHVDVTLADIHAAASRIRGAVYRTPCVRSERLSQLCGCEVWCKLEHLQITGSFKERGARHLLERLDPATRAHGVIAASAGNHALGLAWHGRALGVPVQVVMPRFAPIVKVSQSRAFGAEVLLHGDTYDDAKREARRLAVERGRTYVPGFDHPDIIAGQGTIGLEILDDVPEPDAILVPAGGGGLVAGIGVAVKALRPQTQIIAVEPAHAASLAAGLAAGKPVRISLRATLADGLAVAEVGKLPLALARRVVDRCVTVDEATIAQAVVRLLELEKAVVEGGGAVGLAALLSRTVAFPGGRVVLVLSGGNIDLTVLGRIIDRGLAADGRLCRVHVAVAERPGSLARLLTLVAEHGGSIREVQHDRSFAPADPALVAVTLLIETSDREHIARLAVALGEGGYESALDGPPAGGV